MVATGHCKRHIDKEQKIFRNNDLICSIKLIVMFIGMYSIGIRGVDNHFILNSKSAQVQKEKVMSVITLMECS